MTSLDSYQKLALSCFKLSSLEELKSLSCLKDIPLKDRIEVGVYYGTSLIEINELCIDNHRIFSVDNTKEYKDVQSKGSAGSFDGKITCQSGASYLVGFNYGH
jgi:hypothetical protein